MTGQMIKVFYFIYLVEEKKKIILHSSLKLTTQEDWTVLIYSMNSSDPGIKLSTE